MESGLDGGRAVVAVGLALLGEFGWSLTFVLHHLPVALPVSLCPYP